MIDEVERTGKQYSEVKRNKKKMMCKRWMCRGERWQWK